MSLVNEINTPFDNQRFGWAMFCNVRSFRFCFQGDISGVIVSSSVVLCFVSVDSFFGVRNEMVNNRNEMVNNRNEMVNNRNEMGNKGSVVNRSTEL